MGDDFWGYSEPNTWDYGQKSTNSNELKINKSSPKKEIKKNEEEETRGGNFITDAGNKVGLEGNIFQQGWQMAEGLMEGRQSVIDDVAQRTDDIVTGGLQKINMPGAEFIGDRARNIAGFTTDVAFPELWEAPLYGAATALDPVTPIGEAGVYSVGVGKRLLMKGHLLSKKIDHWLGKDFDLFNPKGLFNRNQPVTAEGITVPNTMLMHKSDDLIKGIRNVSPEYRNVVTSGMERMGMKNDIFDIGLYNKNSNILEEMIDPIGGKLRKDGTRQTRKLGKRHWMEYFLSPQSLKGDFEVLRKSGKVAANETWEGFLKKRGLTTADIQAHHINPLYDSMHLFDGVKWGSDEYWDIVSTLINRGARPGVVQKGDSINNIIRTFGKSSLTDTPHGIAHEFYRDVMPVFFSKNEVLKMKNSHKYRMQKTKRWAGIVNRSEEILLETHKAWKSLNPKTRMDFNELVETMSKYDDKGVIKGIHQKYQVKDIQELVKEVQYQDFMQRLQADDSLAAWMLNVDKEFMVDIISGVSKKDLVRKWGKKYNLKKMGMKQLDLFLK